MINLYTDKETGKQKEEKTEYLITLLQLRQPLTCLMEKNFMVTSLKCPATRRPEFMREGGSGSGW